MADAPCIRLFTQPNQGVAKARNAGLRLVPPDADVVTFLDSDDISPAHRFATDLPNFESDPALELIYSFVCMVDRIDEEKLEPAEGAEATVVRGLQLGAGIYRRQLLKKTGFFDEDFVQAEDTDYLFRIFEREPRKRLVDGIGVYYRQHPGTLTGQRDVVRREFMRAVAKSMRRRRSDPTLGTLESVFATGVIRRPLSGVSVRCRSRSSARRSDSRQFGRIATPASAEGKDMGRVLVELAFVAQGGMKADEPIADPDAPENAVSAEELSGFLASSIATAREKVSASPFVVKRELPELSLSLHTSDARYAELVATRIHTRGAASKASAELHAALVSSEAGSIDSAPPRNENEALGARVREVSRAHEFSRHLLEGLQSLADAGY